ncbi:MAG: hypothetical protein ACYSWQ_21980 [Planctomycetota bacterium]|jgi:hypothetical protein
MIGGDVAALLISHFSHFSKGKPFVRKLVDSLKAHEEGIVSGNLRRTDDNLCVNVGDDYDIIDRHG